MNTIILFSAIGGIFIILYVIKYTSKPKLQPYSLNSNTPKDLVYEINSVRSFVGLEPLVECKNLNEMALAFITDQYHRQYWSHTTPEGSTPVDRARDVSYLTGKPSKIYELLAYDKPSPSAAVSAWIKDETNAAIIQNPDARHIGCAGIQGAVESWKSLGYDNWNRVLFWCVVIASGGACSVFSVSSDSSPFDAKPACLNNECVFLGTMQNSVPQPYSGIA